MTYVFTTSITCINPFLNPSKILHMRKNQNKAVQTHSDNGDMNIPVFKFNKFASIYIESQYLLFVTNGACRSYNSSTCHAFNIKQTFAELKKVKIGGNYFGTSSPIEDNTYKQKCIIYHEKIWMMCSFFEHFFFSLTRHFSESCFYNFNDLITLTAFFVIEFILFFKRRKFQSESFWFDDHNANECKRNEILQLVFFVFFAHTSQTYDNDTGTLTISVTSDFGEIDKYINVTKHVIICCEVDSIPSGSFFEWTSLNSVNISDSVISIGGYAFCFCSNLSTLIIGENVKSIGGSSFSLCHSLTSIIIPNSVTLIGDSAFCLCSNLSTLIIGENVIEIGNYVFGNCYKLECIYFYGTSEPIIGENAFYNVSTSVITFSSYQSERFGNLFVSNGTAVDGCSPMPTHTFTESLLSDAILSFTLSLTYSLSLTRTITLCVTHTNFLSLSAFSSSLTHVRTELVFYAYTAVAYSSYRSFYTHFFTIIFPASLPPAAGLTTPALAGIVCGAVAAAFVIAGVVVFLMRSSRRSEESSAKEEFNETTTRSSANLVEDLDGGIGDMAKEDEDNWI